MADQTNVTTQTIEINTDKAYESIADLTRQLGDITKITAEAKEGITHVGNEYQFANAELQKWYDTLKQMDLAHNKTTTDIVNDMQNAAAATKIAATATEEYGHKVAAAAHGVTGSLHTQKLAFEDIGRLALGEKLGLRQFAANFGLIGTAASIAAFAIYEYGGQLVDLIQPLTDAQQKQEDLNKVMDEASKKVGESTIQIEKMQAQFKDSTSISDRKKALDDYNKTFGDVIGYAKTFEEAEQRLKDHTQDYIDAMTFRAKADAAYALQKEALGKALKAQVENETSFFAKVGSFASKMIGVGGIAEATKITTESTKALVEENNKAAKSYADIAKEAEDAFAAAKKSAGGGTNKPTKDKTEHDNSLKEQKSYLEESQKLTENAEQKEIQSEEIKYEKIRADLIAHHHSTEELDAQHEQNVIDIHKKYADQLAEIFKKEAAKTAEDEAKLQEKFLKDAAKQQEEAEKLQKKEHDLLQKGRKEELNAQFQNGQLQIKQLKGEYDHKRAIIDNDRLQAKAALDMKVIDQTEYNKRMAELSADELEIKKQQAEQEKMIANAAVSTLDSLAKIAGEKTQAGKDLAIAAATIKAIQAGINTFEGFTSEFPGPVGIALGAIAAAGVGIALFEEVKKIESVKIPGGGGGSSASSPSSGGGGSVPGAPQIPKNSQSTTLSNATIDRLKPTQNQEPIRAVVVESDITNSQARIASYQRGSSLH